MKKIILLIILTFPVIVSAEFVNVKIKYSSLGKIPNTTVSIPIYVSSKNPTESEVTSVIKRKNPKWNFFIIKIN